MTISVLVVEDDFLIGDCHRQTIEDLGWTVFGPVATVEASLMLLAREEPSVAMLDMQLGKDLVTPVALELRRRGIPFFVASGLTDIVAAGGEVFTGIVNVGKVLDGTLISEQVDRLCPR